jgi:hypothetical protein
MTGRSLLIPALLLVSSLPVAAQTASPPPHLSVLDGRAVLTRGQDQEAAVANTPLALGDRLATEYGRAEVLMGDGTALHLDESTTVDLNGDSVVRLLSGRLIVLATTASAGRLQIDTAAASVRGITAGEYHVAVFEEGGQAATRVAVVRGEVDVESELGRMPVIAGRNVFVREGEAPGAPLPFNSARADAFVRWSENLVDGRRASTSAQYLPADVRVYGSTFDQYGSWSYDAPYGYVWYPRVAGTWRPYHHGRWRYGAGFGWTFVGYDPWGWATHHYGRWGLSPAGAWFWIPTPGWGAAWVQWAAAPGYVSWCPLGWNNRPVLGFWGHGPRRAHYNDHWRAWSVVPLDTFRRGVPIHRQRFDPSPFTGPRAPSFVLQPTPPATAIPRGSVVPPSSRIAGPSVAPRAGQSRRGPAVAGGAATGAGSRRGAPGGSLAASAPAAAAPAGAAPPASAVAPSAPARGDRGVAVPRGARPGPPAVIYHRGTPSDAGRSGAAAPYDRAGVAVPRGLPADAGRADAPAEPGRGRAVSPYGEYQSPYGRDRGGAMVTRTGDHPDYAVPRATPRGGDAPPPRYEPRSEPSQPRSGPPQPRSEPRSSSPPPDSGRSRQAAPPPSSRGDGGSRASSPPPSRGQSAPPAARSGGSRGGSTGTAVPRRR